MQTFPTPFRSDAKGSEPDRRASARGAGPPSPFSPRARDQSRAASRAGRHHPSVLAALCYAVPVVPGMILLLRERDNRFVRFHAAQSLVFFGLVAAGQVGLYAVLIVAGGLIANDLVASVTAAVMVLLFLSWGIVALVVWLGLLADCISGNLRPLPVAGAWAARLERASLWPER